MKKLLIILSLILSLNCYAIDKIRVKSLMDYSSITPFENFKVEVIEDNFINDKNIYKGDIINCKLEKTKDPKRGKIDAKIYFKVINVENKKGTYYFKENLIAKYATKVINKEQLKEIEPKKAVKKTAGVVGNFFVQGFSYALSFADGVISNEEDNRLKSGAKKVYNDSILSYVETGEDVFINKGDIFYLIIKLKEEEKEEI